jgi:hypothetical protein
MRRRWSWPVRFLRFGSNGSASSQGSGDILACQPEGEYTPYGIAISLVAAAQVNEMNCKMKGQISLALAKVKRLGVPIDLDDKEDYSAVLFQATQIMAAARKEGSTSWCKARSANMDAFLRSD